MKYNFSVTIKCFYLWNPILLIFLYIFVCVILYSSVYTSLFNCRFFRTSVLSKLLKRVIRFKIIFSWSHQTKNNTKFFFQDRVFELVEFKKFNSNTRRGKLQQLFWVAPKVNIIFTSSSSLGQTVWIYIHHVRFLFALSTLKFTKKLILGK